ncbi:MAG: hypothetical protein OEZ57_14460, partial [Nitrospirota bacterium]|nr:hypothetical protein [Nitrospirota bacterium]
PLSFSLPGHCTYSWQVRLWFLWLKPRLLNAVLGILPIVIIETFAIAIQKFSLLSYPHALNAASEILDHDFGP